MCSSIFTKFYSSMYCISKFDIAIFFCSQICALILSVDNERGVVIKPKLILKKLTAYSVELFDCCIKEKCERGSTSNKPYIEKPTMKMSSPDKSRDVGKLNINAHNKTSFGGNSNTTFVKGGRFWDF